MFKNYIKIAWRNLIAEKFYSLVSILGLVLGMTCCLVIGLWVVQERSYNNFFPEGEHVYHVKANSLFNGELRTGSQTPAPLAEALLNEVPQVEYAVKCADWGPRILVKDETSSIRESGLYASDGFFNIFQFPAIEGDPVQALATPGQIILTQSTAKKLFSQTPAMGETVLIQTSEEVLKPLIVGAIVEDVPTNSSVRFNWVANFKEIEQPWMQWGNTSYSTWIKTVPNSSVEELEAVSKSIYAKHSDFKDTYPVFQPLKDVHLYGTYENGKAIGGHISFVTNLAWIGLLILVVSCINFISLVTARASARGKEIGIRKVIGADKGMLMAQFGCESLLVSTLALSATLVLTLLILPVFNTYLGLQIAINASDKEFWLLLAGIWALTMLLSSLYPSFYLAGLSNFLTAKSSSAHSMAGEYFRKGLIAFQFFISTLFVVGILVIFNQLKYVQQANTGINKENVLYVPLEGELYQNMEVVRQELSKSPSVISSTVATALPINIQSSSGDLSWPGKDPDLQTNVAASWVGYDFISTMGIKMAEGREFSPLHVGDSVAYLVNQAAVDLMGIENPIGQEISFWNGSASIIGVMENFHLQSLHAPIQPLILVLEPLNSSYLLVRMRENDLAEGIADLKAVVETFNPMYPFEYHFLDQDYDRLYKTDQIIGRLIFTFGGIALFISCLGLLGLVAFTASKRIKEIGIRKVLGASVAEITGLLSKSFVGLILLGWLAALPVSRLLLNRWLEGFAYAIALEWWYFIAAGLLTLLIALLTVSYQSIKAALTNPVESLRSE